MTFSTTKTDLSIVVVSVVYIVFNVEKSALSVFGNFLKDYYCQPYFVMSKQGMYLWARNKLGWPVLQKIYRTS